MTISVREASLEDLPRMTNLTTRALVDDETFGDFMHSHRYEFPEDWGRVEGEGITTSWLMIR